MVDELGESPLGVTYRARHLDTGKYERLTVLRPDVATPASIADVRDAIARTARIDHQGVLKPSVAEEHDGVVYFTAEDFEGQTLRELLQQYRVDGKKFELKEAAQITTQILEALSAAHNAGLYLRALRPEYVLVHTRYTGPRQATFVSRTKILANALWDRVPAGVLAEDEFTKGEAQYMAPELKGFNPEANARADVYSAGVIFYEMLTGTAPVGTFQQPSQLRPDLPRRVNDIVELAIASSPDDRYRAPADLLLDIQRLFSEPDVTAFGARAPGRNVYIGLGVGGALVVGAVATILFVVSSQQESPTVTADRVRATVRDAHVIPPAAEIAAVQERHPPNMVYVPPGPFVSGRLHFEAQDAFASEPLAEVKEVPGYLIDLFEFPNLRDSAPTVSVSWQQASDACVAAGKRLCSADEWEKACKGPLNTVYAYGDFFDETFCGNGLEDPARAGARPECKSRWQVFDQSGGFREWTGTSPARSDGRAIVMGGMRGNPTAGTRCSFRIDESKAVTEATMTFRCCRDVDAPPPTPPAPPTPPG